MAAASRKGSARVGSAVGTEAGGAGASARRDQRGPLQTVPLKSQRARSGRAPWLRRLVWSMLGSGSPRRGRGGAGRVLEPPPTLAPPPCYPSPGGGWRITPGPKGSSQRSKGWSPRGDERQELCRPVPDLHPTFGCQPEARALGANAGEGLGCWCQQAPPQPCLEAPAWHPSLPFSVVLSVFCNLWRNVDGIRCTSPSALAFRRIEVMKAHQKC